MRSFVANPLIAGVLLLVPGAGAQPVSRSLPSPPPAAEGPAAPGFRGVEPGQRAHSFYFSRAAYGGGGWRGRSWMTDYPKADEQFLTVLRRLTGIDAYPDAHPVRLDDPELRRFPFLYAVEVGYMDLRDSEVQGLRDYLLAGGFLVVDDFWGTAEWNSFEQQMRRVLPGHEIVELPMDHPIFSAYYQIDEIIQVPNVGQGMAGGRTHERDGYTARCLGIFDERDGYTARCLGIFDERGRLMVVINWNTDLGDAWEWAEQERYPLRFSTYAYQMGANFIVYAMSH